MNLKDRLIIVWKSFFLQSVFNYERFQNVGFLFSVLAYLKKIHKSSDELKRACLRHFEIFNTQPYMSGFVIGNVLKNEEELKDAKEIINIKHSLACAYAAIGDRIFWARLRLVIFQITFLIFAILYFLLPYKNEIIFVSASVPTVFYALLTVYIRYTGVKYGYEMADKKICGLDKFNWNKIIITLSRIGFSMHIVVIMVALFLFGYFSFGLTGSRYTDLLVAVIAVLLQRYFRRDKKNIFYPILTFILISFILGLVL